MKTPNRTKSLVRTSVYAGMGLFLTCTTANAHYAPSLYGNHADPAPGDQSQVGPLYKANLKQPKVQNPFLPIEQADLGEMLNAILFKEPNLPVWFTKTPSPFKNNKTPFGQFLSWVFGWGANHGHHHHHGHGGGHCGGPVVPQPPTAMTLGAGILVLVRMKRHMGRNGTATPQV